ncbi:MAG: phosphodiester glycosidase family protein [Eubacteriales bacterium]|nr:phosphodiester glycosidase family protein [Eubacteriales bacterium]
MKRGVILISALIILFAASCGNGEPVSSSVPSATDTTAPQNTQMPTPTELETLVYSMDYSAEPTPIPTPIPTPTAEPTEEPTPTPYGLCGTRFEGRFTDGDIVDKKNSFKSKDIDITITKVADDRRTGDPLTYFVVDIFVQNIECLRTYFAGGSFGNRTASATSISKELGALLAISGDSVETRSGGLIVRNGEVLRTKIIDKWDACVLYKDGTMQCYSPQDTYVDAILQKEPWQTWSFGPMLLDSVGAPMREFNLPDSISARNPRAAIGYYEPGHYCLVLVDGRQSGYSQGMTLIELSKLMYDLGCRAAYNLDGGETVRLLYHDKLVNSPTGNRNLRDVIYLVPTEVNP